MVGIVGFTTKKTIHSNDLYDFARQVVEATLLRPLYLVIFLFATTFSKT